jgi:hypothetical protein
VEEPHSPVCILKNENMDNFYCFIDVLLGTNYFGRQSQLSDIKL